MNLTAAQIGKVVEEISEPLKGAFVNKIFQTGQNEWILELRKEGVKRHLLISLAPRFSRIHMVSNSPSEDERLEPGHFTKLLKKQINRCPVSGINQIENDRVVLIGFHTHDGGCALAVELMGVSGNIYFLDKDNAVTAMALNRKSRNSLGKPYTQPELPKQSGQPVTEDGPALNEKDEFPYNSALERALTGPAREERLNEIRNRAAAPLKAEIKKAQKRIKALERDKTELVKFEGDKQLGDLLQANFRLIAKGMNSIEVDNLFDPDGGKIAIPLDSASSPEKNVQRYYKRHRKYEQGLPRIETELAGLIGKNEASRVKIEEINSAESIEKILIHLPEQKAGPGKASKKVSKQPTGPKKFTSSDGHTILVGRNDRENDEISFKTANGRDLWLHARDYPGSHVLVRLPKGLETPQTTLREAAMLALHYSKAAKSGKGEVTWQHAKNVRKPKGAPPGKAMVTDPKTVFVKIDEAKIKAMKPDRDGY